MDRVFATFLLVLFSPFFATSALLVYLSMGRPVLFRQKRPGSQEQIFEILKFRTMSNDCDENGNLLSDEKRVTKIGIFLRHTSLDELPQLINILRGDMSFVGPRPLLVEYLPLYNQKQKKRHKVKPGITGWAQVNGRNGISWEEKFELDIWYVEHVSFCLDIKILGMTFLGVLKRSNIGSGKSISMEKFEGSKDG